MFYEMDELLPLVSKLADRYTSFSSTSLPYEKARMLMEAVIYCIRECTGKDGGNLLSGGEVPDAEILYKRGYEIVKEKVYKSKMLYEQIIEEFEDYGCRNYRDTVIGGVPSFFLYYDPRFCPQNHLLTLDYPAGITEQGRTGADLMESYLYKIKMEKIFLQFFPSASVCALLERITPDYGELYLDNICLEVLCCSVKCAAAGAPLMELCLNRDQEQKVYDYFKGDTLQQIKRKTGSIISKMTERMEDEELKAYLISLGSECGAAIKIYMDSKERNTEEA